MPPEIVDQEMYKIFGGYSEYMDAPYSVVQKHRLVVQAKWEVEYEQQKKQNEELEDAKRKAGS